MIALVSDSATVPASDAPTAPTAPPGAAPGDGPVAVPPEAILRMLADEIARNPFAGGKRAHAVRVAGQGLHAALERVTAARAHLAECEAAAEVAAASAGRVLADR